MERPLLPFTKPLNDYLPDCNTVERSPSGPLNIGDLLIQWPLSDVSYTVFSNDFFPDHACKWDLALIKGLYFLRLLNDEAGYFNQATISIVIILMKVLLSRVDHHLTPLLSFEFFQVFSSWAVPASSICNKFQTVPFLRDHIQQCDRQRWQNEHLFLGSSGPRLLRILHWWVTNLAI